MTVSEQMISIDMATVAINKLLTIYVIENINNITTALHILINNSERWESVGYVKTAEKYVSEHSQSSKLLS